MKDRGEDCAYYAAEGALDTLELTEEQDYQDMFDECVLTHRTVHDVFHALPMEDKLAKCTERNRILCEKNKKWTAKNKSHNANISSCYTF